MAKKAKKAKKPERLKPIPVPKATWDALREIQAAYIREETAARRALGIPGGYRLEMTVHAWLPPEPIDAKKPG